MLVHHNSFNLYLESPVKSSWYSWSNLKVGQCNSLLLSVILMTWSWLIYSCYLFPLNVFYSFLYQAHQPFTYWNWSLTPPEIFLVYTSSLNIYGTATHLSDTAKTVNKQLIQTYIWIELQLIALLWRELQFASAFLPFTSCVPPPDCRKMPKSAFKLKAIHLHSFDYSINFPSVFYSHPSAAMHCNRIVDDDNAVSFC